MKDTTGMTTAGERQRFIEKTGKLTRFTVIACEEDVIGFTHLNPNIISSWRR